MKQIQYPLLALIIQLTAATSYAALRTDVPKPKLTLTEAQINAIKNERGRPSKDSSSEIFAEDNSEELEELLQMRLREVSHLTHFRDHTSLDKILTFSGLALQAWNPELRHTDTKKMVIKNIINYGFIDGFIVPTMAMMNASYAIGSNGFGNLLNVMLADIVPNLAENFKTQYKVPTESNGENFDQISNHGRQGMWITLMAQLDPDFYQVHNEMETQLVDGRLKPRTNDNSLPIHHSITSEDQFNVYGPAQEFDSKTKEAKVNDFINVNINGDQTAIQIYLKKIGKEDKSAELSKKRKLFSSELTENEKQCAMKCLREVLSGGGEGKTSGEAIGLFAGKKAGLVAKVATVIGAANGIDRCINSSECGGSKEQRAEEKRKKEETEQAAAAEKQKYIDQYNDMIKAESKKQLQEDLKNEEKRKELEKRRQEYEQAKKDAQSNDDSDDESGQQENKWEHGRNEKPKITDEDQKHFSEKDIQKKKAMAEIPMIPEEITSKHFKANDRLDLVVKTMTKEKNSETIKVNVVYPTNPNTGN